MKKKKMLMACIAGVMSLTSLCMGGEKELDFAIEDAASKTILELNDREIPVDNIAFIGVSKDETINHIFRGGLNRISGSYQFFTRNELELGGLSSEIEFGERRNDIMDAKTIKKWGNIKGVDALLYGQILESSVKNGVGTFRVSLTLAEVETAKMLWTANINGEYKTPKNITELSSEMIKAATDAGDKLKNKLLIANFAKKYKVFLLPLTGTNMEQAGVLSKIISSKFTNANNKLQILSAPEGANSNIVKNLSLKLAGSGSASSAGNMKNVLKMLDQSFDVQGKAATAKDSAAYMFGQIMNRSQKGYNTNLTVLYKIQDMNNQTIWSEVVTGVFVDEIGKIEDEKRRKDANETVGLMIDAVENEEVEALIAEGEEFMKNKKWDDAIFTFERILRMKGQEGNRVVNQKLQQAKSEKDKDLSGIFNFFKENPIVGYIIAGLVALFIIVIGGLILIRMFTAPR